MIQFDKVLASLGEFGVYQKRLCFVLFLCTVPNGLQMAATVFQNITPKFRCAVPGLSNDSFAIQSQQHMSIVEAFIPMDGEHFSQCESFDLEYPEFPNGSEILTATDHNNTSTIPCHRWVYDTDGPYSQAVDFDLVCDKAMYKAHGNLMLLVGLLVGSLVGGPLSDFIGRKKSIVSGTVIVSIVASVTALAQSIHFILVLRFLFTAIGSLSFMAVFVMLAETVGTSRRSMATMASMLGWTCGQMLSVLVQYLIRDWRTAQLVQAMPLLSFVGFWWVIQESPRWLLSKYRQREARAVISHIAKVNKVSHPQEMEMMTDSAVIQDEKGIDDVTTASDSNQMKIWQICSQRKILFRFIILCFSWITINMVYYGLMLGIGDIIPGDIYINFLLQSFMDLIGHVLCVFILEKLGRKKIYCSAMIISGLATLGLGMLNFTQGGIQWLPIVLYCLGKLGITIGFDLIFIITTELLPTKIRNSGLGFCSFVARFSGIVSPYIVSASLLIPGPIGKAFPVIIFGAFSLIAGLSSMVLPETRNAQLPETFEDDSNPGSTKNA